MDVVYNKKTRMIIITSISPKHRNVDSQVDAIRSWQGKGSCFSMNSIEELGIINNKNYEGIDIISTHRTVEYFISKKLVNINAMIDLAKIYHEDLMIVNSDILVPKLPDIKENGITVLSRYDYTESVLESEKFEMGFDVFIIPKKFFEHFPPSIYALGAAWWDYWIPFVAMQKGIPLYYPKGRYAFHKKHATQYGYEEWIRIGEYFKWEFKLEHGIHINQIAPMVLEKIKQYLICPQ